MSPGLRDSKGMKLPVSFILIFDINSVENGVSISAIILCFLDSLSSLSQRSLLYVGLSAVIVGFLTVTLQIAVFCSSLSDITAISVVPSASPLTSIVLFVVIWVFTILFLLMNTAISTMQ